MGCMIVAEAGVNHNGNLSEAMSLVYQAKVAGADAVKFQMFDSFRLWGDGRIKHLELTEDEFVLIAEKCNELDIEFMCTPFGIPEVDFVSQLSRRIKIASGCIHRTGLLNAINDTGKPVILSTGMSTLSEVGQALAKLNNVEAVLHCTSAYPCPLSEANLSAMDRLAIETGFPVGYSDHTEGITVAIAAAALGACVIEKHFTLDREADGPDHKASITPVSFHAMVKGIRMVEEAMGDGEKTVQTSERELRKAWGR